MHEWKRPAFRPTYHALAWALVAAVAVQVFLAGLAISGDPSWWRVHGISGHLALYVALALLVLAWAGGGGRRALAPAAVAFGLVFAQSVLINLPTAWLRALHPVNALAIFALAFVAARR